MSLWSAYIQPLLNLFSVPSNATLQGVPYHLWLTSDDWLVIRDIKSTMTYLVLARTHHCAGCITFWLFKDVYTLYGEHLPSWAGVWDHLPGGGFVSWGLCCFSVSSLPQYSFPGSGCTLWILVFWELLLPHRPDVKQHLERATWSEPLLDSVWKWLDLWVT